MIYKQIIEFPRYSINKNGDVISFCSYISRADSTTNKGRSIKPSIPRGYACVTLAKGGTKHTRMLHRLLAQAFIPNPSNKPQVNHKNGAKTDNRLKNLEWMTAKENMRHSSDILRNQHGCNNKMSVLTDENVRFIRKLVTEGMSCPKIATLTGVSDTTIRDIKNRKSWKFV